MNGNYLTQKVHIFFCPYFLEDVKDVDSLTPAEQPTETMVEGHFNGNDGGDGVGIITDTNIYEHCFGYIKANGNRSY